jgi:signal peptidase I
MTDIPFEAAGAPVETRTRSPLLAALVSFLVPGLGHVYAGRATRGLGAGLGAVAWSVAIVQLMVVVPGRALRILLILLLPLGIAWVMWDAARVTRPVRERYVPRRYNRWYVYLLIIFSASIVSSAMKAGLLRYVAHAFKLPGTSMEPTLLRGDFILTSPRLPATIRHGDVMVYGDATGTLYIHRVVAVGGDTVAMRNKVLWLNGRPVPEPFVAHSDPNGYPDSGEMGWQRAFLADPVGSATYAPTRDDWGPLRVPAGQYLMLGDDRDNSHDGRWKGFVPRGAIVGRPVWIYFSRGEGGPVRWSRIGTGVR